MRDSCLRLALEKIHSSGWQIDVNWFHTICTQYNQIYTNQQVKALSKSTPRTHDLTRGSATTTKVSYSSSRSPQRVGSIPTLILHKPTTKVKEISSQLSPTSGWYKFLGVIHKFGDSQATSIRQGTQGSKTNKSAQDSSLRWAREVKRKGESRWNQQRVRLTSPHTKGPSINWRRCDFGCERWIECSCLRVGQPKNRGEGRSEWRERVGGVYKKAPKSWWPLGNLDWKPVEPVSTRVDLGSLADSAGEWTSSEFGWTGPKIGWTDFPTVCTRLFLTGLTNRLAGQKVAEGTVQKPVEPVFSPVEPVFETGEQIFRNWREPWGNLSEKWKLFFQVHSWSSKMFS
jgi:hypothetical protein